MKMRILSVMAAAFLLGGFAATCGDDDSCDNPRPTE